MSAQREAINTASTMQNYMNKLAKTQIYDKEQTNALFARYRAGDLAAKNLIMESNLRYVVKLAHKYTADQELVMDLISEGNIGMMRAIEKFDPSMGFAFLTYADRWIRCMIEEFMMHHSKVVSVPVHIHRLSRKVYKAQEALISVKGSASLEDLVAATGEDAETIYSILELNQSVMPMNKALDNDEGQGGSLGDYISDDRFVPDQPSEMDSSRAWLMSKIDKLPFAIKNAILCYFGFAGKTEMNYAEIGRATDISRERVRQQVALGLQYLRDMADKDGVDLAMLTSEE